MYIEDKQMLVLNFVFYLLWTGWGPSACSVALFGFRELKYSEKQGCRESRCSSGTNALVDNAIIVKVNADMWIDVITMRVNLLTNMLHYFL